ncbi:penicillin-binding protein 2 [Ammonifex degensii KC4]|uniref:Penicillin-binding protein 2 n=1 Tax=Ammonifex degensii (strain DSM 10501 / KC4) TaxID=429009 RepID=C9R8K3_AMMDK|nr:penicillin-binding protein 2 [Ammonifex degensii]ACX52632.1 penicillin-binding protein 2 [Ammonifex degensii KC4]
MASPVEHKGKVFLLVCALLFTILFLRLGYLQIWRGEHYAVLAKENCLRLVLIRAPRGEVFDRNGQKIVGNRPVYALSYVNLGKPVAPDLVKRLAGLLNMDPAEIEKKIKEGENSGQPVRLATNVPLQAVTYLEEHHDEFPGIMVEIVPVRYYPYGSVLAQVLGYVHEISAEQLKKHKDEGYAPGDFFGQDGLEYAFERYLRGKDGARYIEVDAVGRPVRDLGVKPPTPGDNLELTIDLKVQQAAEAALEKAVKEARKKGFPAPGGAAVVEDVHTGEILAMASYPSYDPSVFTRGLTPVEAKALFQNPDSPLLNRALSAYPPGSTFKMVTALAALEAGIINPDFTVFCSGYYRLGSHIFRDWLSSGHGTVNLKRALQVSCNVYFWTVGQMTGIDRLARMARELGLGEKTGITLPGEMAGVVPTPEYKYKRMKAYLDSIFEPKFKAVEEEYARKLKATQDPKEREKLEKEKDRRLQALRAEYQRYAWDLDWHTYDTLNTAIGQGYVSCTPLQLVNYTATLANGGTRYRPFLVKKIVAPDGRTVASFGPEVLGRLKVKPEYLKAVQEGMSLVTQGDGTAAGVFNGLPVKVAGKTGSAEVPGKGTCALFVGYAPADNPRVAVAVVVENAGHGGAVAAPVAKEILSAYFGG